MQSKTPMREMLAVIPKNLLIVVRASIKGPAEETDAANDVIAW
ncbi:MAG: hypothetical protein Q8L08_05420 [Candidatus Nanopelagicaceae bacterium]|nr:hypothetical protein [Candidatus Nanopelagicaceae bacterium]